MANRFFDTNYYKSPFVRALKGSLKSLYSFIICDCDGAGVWNLDLQAAGLYTGYEISEEDFDNHFIKPGKAIHLGGLKFFFPDFIEHQYPKGLQANNKAHKNFIETLKKAGVLNPDLSVKNKEALKELHRPTGLGIGLGNGNGQGNGHVSASVFYDAEKEILGNQIELERICMATNKSVADAKSSLRKFHLFLAEGEKYPKTRKAIFAGFEKWLMNEKNFKQNGKGASAVGKEIEFD
jgi:hypothetical protein